MSGILGHRHVVILFLVLAANVVSADTTNYPNPNDGNTVDATLRFDNRTRRFSGGSLDVNILRNATLESGHLRRHSRRPATRSSSPAIDAVTAEVRRYFAQYREQLHVNPNEIIVSKITRFTDLSLPGRISVLRYHKGTRVMNAAMTVYFDASTGEVSKLRGGGNAWRPFPADLPSSNVDSSQATSIARTHIGEPSADIGQTELQYRFGTNDLTLIWTVYLKAPLPSLTPSQVYIDAETGKVISSRQNVYR
jgi:Zn-dependent metalloprotease